MQILWNKVNRLARIQGVYREREMSSSRFGVSPNSVMLRPAKIRTQTSMQHYWGSLTVWTSQIISTPALKSFFTIHYHPKEISLAVWRLNIGALRNPFSYIPTQHTKHLKIAPPTVNRFSPSFAASFAHSGHTLAHTNAPIPPLFTEIVAVETRAGSWNCRNRFRSRTMVATARPTYRTFLGLVWLFEVSWMFWIGTIVSSMEANAIPHIWRKFVIFSSCRFSWAIKIGIQDTVVSKSSKQIHFNE